MKFKLSAQAFIICISGAALLWAARGETAKNGFIGQVRAHYAAWDTNRDNTLSVNEVELALTNPGIKGEEAAAIAALRRGMRAKGIKSATLEELNDSVPFDAKKKPAPPQYDSMYEVALQKINSVKRELFVTETPQLDGLGQGRLGDCFLLAALGTYINHDPEGLKKMMDVQPDGQVAVTFGTGKCVVLPTPTDGEVVIGALTRNQGTWANMFEKSVGQVFLEGQKTERHVAPYGIIGVGGSPHTVLQLITGHKVVRVGCENIRKPGLDAATREAKLAELRAILIRNQEAGRMMVAGNGAIGEQNAVTVPGIYYLHSYGVLGYDPKADTVTFWNPFGNGYKPKGEPGLKYGYVTKYGRFTVPLSEAVQWLGSFSVESEQRLDG
ncbi:hypothetical protein EON83_03140 [bacterium]|nr:MAG: hypothetical protein EON83_03140 [bacterium]